MTGSNIVPVPTASGYGLVRLRGRSETHTDRSLSDRFAASVDFDGFVSALGLALRDALPLRAFEFEDNSELDLRDVPPPSREADLSTWRVPRSLPSVGLRWHGIVQHRQRKPTSVRRKPTSEFESVSLSRLLYATTYVVLPLLPTFLDPPWLLLSSHPARFDQPVVPHRTIVGLHHLHGRTSAFKNCLFGGSLPSILPSLSSWQSSALYYDCWVFRRLRRDMSFWDLSFLHCTTLTRSGEETNIVGLMVKLWGGSTFSGSIPGDQAGCYKRSWGEKVILIRIKRCSFYLLGCWSSRGEYGGCFHVEEFPRTIFGIC